MELFIDTADLKEIEEVSKYPFVKGVTTNPSLIAKANLTQKEVITRITSLIDGPISAEVTKEDMDGMIEQALKLHEIDKKNIVIKLPMTIEGLKACKYLTDRGIKTNVTLCFSLAQALLAMEANATYVSPFMGRLDDNGFDSLELIKECVQLKKNYGYQTKIIAASIRSVKHVEDCALTGSDIATVPYKILMKLIKHSLTDAGLETFKLDAQKTAKLEEKK